MIANQNLLTTAAAPPSHLRKRGRNYWETVVSAVEMEGSDLELLRAACEQLDRADAARLAIRREGMFTTDRWDKPKAHPAVAIEVAALNAFRQLQRELCLADAPPDARPAGAPRGYR